MLIYNVKDFGAKGDGFSDDRVAIQKAIDAAHKAGGGQVYVPAGEYRVSAAEQGGDGSEGAIMLKNNVEFSGAGMGITVIKLVDGNTDSISGIIRTESRGAVENIKLNNLTIDGNRDFAGGKVEGFLCGVKNQYGPPTKNISIEGVEIKNSPGYGFDPHEITQNFVIKNSIAHHNTKDGFVADYLEDSLYENNVAWDNTRHGFNITTTTNNTLFKNNVAYGNGFGVTGGAGMVFQRGGFDIPVTFDNTVDGGAFYDNGREGISLRLAETTSIQNVDVYGNLRHGIRMDGAWDSIVQNSVIRGNSQEANLKYNDIQIDENADSITGNTFASHHNNITKNVIYSNWAVGSKYRVQEILDSSDHNTVTENLTFSVPAKATQVLLKGANSTFTPYSNPPAGGADGEIIVGLISGDLILGSPLNEAYIGGSGGDTISGNSGNDRLYGDDDDDMLYGNENNDSIFGDSGSDSIEGGDGNDSIFGGDNADNLRGNQGNDTIFGDDGNDLVNGDEDNDSIFGGNGSNTIYGGIGNDTTYGGDDADTIYGDDGNDFLYGFKGDDNLNGGNGNDTMAGDDGNDTITGAQGNDLITGFQGNDSIFGNEGDDTIAGGAGNDFLTLGTGADSVSAGTGSDTIVCSIDNNVDRIFYTAQGNKDLIFGFNASMDIIQIDKAIYSDYDTARANMIYTSDGRTVIFMGSHGFINMPAVQLSLLSSANFEFV